jgi:hypothetical protein
MAVTFLPQAQLRYPGNADVSQNINALGESISKSLKEGRDRNSLLKVGTALRSGDTGAAQEAAFESGNPQLALSVNNLIERKAERAEDRSWRETQADRAQKNADRSFNLQAQNSARDDAFRREQFELNKKIQDQNFQLKLREIDAKADKLENKLTPGQKAADKAFADEYVPFRAAGGFADVDKQIKQIESVAERLEKGEDLTGPVRGITPDWMAAFSEGGRKSVNARELVEEVAQRNLRLILGGQFAQMEGQQLIKRAYNPSLSEAENAARLRSLATQMRTAAKQKQDASDYFEKNGTIAGFTGTLPSPSTFSTSSAGGAAPPPPPGFVVQ